jgi:hypothetical protein
VQSPEEIDMSRADHVAWVKSRNEPALWHQAAMAVLAYCHDDHGFLAWLIEREEMDRATAGWLFLWPEGSLYLLGKTQTFGLLDHSSEAEMVDLLNKLCLRSERRGFVHDELGLDADFDGERRKCLGVAERGEVVEGRMAPMAILSQPFKRPSPSKYYAVDEGLIEVLA